MEMRQIWLSVTLRTPPIGVNTRKIMWEWSVMVSEKFMIIFHDVSHIKVNVVVPFYLLSGYR